MHVIDTDYLVVGAGASGMAFVDTLLAHSDARIVLVDRRHHAGGHWLDAYPFVRLHQPSANYGVASRGLGEDRIDTCGPNAGFYERASAAEICSYFARVLEVDLVSLVGFVISRVRVSDLADASVLINTMLAAGALPARVTDELPLSATPDVHARLEAGSGRWAGPAQAVAGQHPGQVRTPRRPGRRPRRRLPAGRAPGR